MWPEFPSIHYALVKHNITSTLLSDGNHGSFCCLKPHPTTSHPSTILHSKGPAAPRWSLLSSFHYLRSMPSLVLEVRQLFVVPGLILNCSPFSPCTILQIIHIILMKFQKASEFSETWWENNTHHFPNHPCHSHNNLERPWKLSEGFLKEHKNGA